MKGQRHPIPTWRRMWNRDFSVLFPLIVGSVPFREKQMTDSSRGFTDSRGRRECESQEREMMGIINHMTGIIYKSSLRWSSLWAACDIGGASRTQHLFFP